MIQVTAAVIVRDGRILIAKRRSGISLANKWEFPGGKVEPDEAMVRCLKREVEEELGIKVEVDDFICMNNHVYSFGEIELFAYKAHIISGALQLKEYDEVKWVLPSELLLYDFAEATIPICKRVMEDA